MLGRTLCNLKVACQPRPFGPSWTRLLAGRWLRLRAELGLHLPRPLRIRDVVGMAGVLPFDHRDGALAHELATRGADPRAPRRAALGLRSLVLAAREGLDLLRDAHAAPVVAAHGAEVSVDLEVLVVQRARRLAVEGELELAGPVERRPRARQLVVPGACARDAARDVARVCGDLVGDAPGLHVLGAGQADVL